MATTNPYAFGLERNFVHDVPLLLLSILKCTANGCPKRICAISGDKQYTRKESDNCGIGNARDLLFWNFARKYFNQ
ncbi:MAG: hypothetical protein ABIO19_13605 [Burkholderiaceae bacterium]